MMRGFAAGFGVGAGLVGLGVLAAYLVRGERERLSGGLADGRDPRGFDPGELARGVVVELEHTHDPAIASEIARDHLVEDPAYYAKLAAAGL